MNNIGELQGIFQSNEVFVLADNEEFLQNVENQGFRVMHLASVNQLPSNTVNVSFSDAGARKVFELASENTDARMIFCAAHVFDNSLSSAIYSLDLMRQSNFIEALNKQQSVIELLSNKKRMSFSGNGSLGVVTIIDGVSPFGLQSNIINEPFVHSVAEFFEVHFSHVDPNEPCPFHLDGAIEVSGILTVLRPTGINPYHGSDTDVQRLVSDVARARKSILRINNNIIFSFDVDGKEEIDLLKKIGGKRGVNLTEFAIGVNQSIKGIINYGINSQLNEGIDGIHVAIGDGTTGYHIDFLSPGVRVFTDNA